MLDIDYMCQICYVVLVFSVVFLGGCNEDMKQEQAGSRTADLKFNLYADSTYRYTAKSNTVIRQKKDDENTLTINQNMTIMSTYDVIAAKPGEKTVSVTYERITMSTGNQLLSLDYDSENDDGSDPFYEDLRSLIDKNFNMVVADDGRILSSEPISAGAEYTGKYNNSDSSIRKIMSHFLYIYPGKPLSVGDIWERSYSTSAGFAGIRVKNKYQLVDIKQGVAHIELQGIVSSSNTQQAGNTTVLLKGSQSGSLDVDIITGIVLNGKIKQSLSGKMNITGENSPVEMESNIYIMGHTQKTNGSER